MTTGPVGTPASPPGAPAHDVVTTPAGPSADTSGTSGADPGDPSPGTAAAVRRWLSARPLRTRLVAVLAVVLLAALAVSGWASQSLLRSYLLDQVDLELKASASQATGIALRAADESDPFGPFALDKGLPGGYVVRFWYAGTDPDAAVTVPTAFAEYGPRFPRYDGDDLDTPRIATVASLEGHDSWRV
jgi:two-component system, OmpR family, sensor kinase